MRLATIQWHFLDAQRKLARDVFKSIKIIQFHHNFLRSWDSLKKIKTKVGSLATEIQVETSKLLQSYVLCAGISDSRGEIQNFSTDECRDKN